MPIEEQRCDGDGCTAKHLKCPECGGNHVTPRERHGTKSPNDIVDFGGEGEFEWVHICWDCGWEEWVTVEISRR